MVVSPGVPSYPAARVPFGVFLLSACSPTVVGLGLGPVVSRKSRRCTGWGYCNRVRGIDWKLFLVGSLRESDDEKADGLKP